MYFWVTPAQRRRMGAAYGLLVGGVGSSIFFTHFELWASEIALGIQHDFDQSTFNFAFASLLSIHALMVPIWSS
jgi:hypothetical protein